jgi:hypothetical protein
MENPQMRERTIDESKNAIRKLTVAELQTVAGGGTNPLDGAGGTGPTNPVPRPPLFPSN